MSGRTGYPFKRTAIVSVLAIAATVATVVLPSFAGAEEEFVNGSGRAKAAIVRVGPSAGQLSLAPSAGVSLADHLGVLGRGESLVVDYAALDGSVQDSIPKATQGNVDPKRKNLPPLRVECTVDRCDGYKRQESLPGIVQEGEAKAKPAGASVEPDGASVSTLRAVEVPGVLKVSEGRASTFSGIFRVKVDGQDKQVRRAGGAVDIGAVDVLGGTVVLKGLHWEAMQETDENDDTTPAVSGKFVVGQAVVGDPLDRSKPPTTFDGPLTGDHLKQVLDQVNGGFDKMGPADPGIRLVAPTLANVAGAARLTPLTIQILDSDLGKTVVGPVAEGLQPVRDQVTKQFLDNCTKTPLGSNCGLPLLVADVGVGVISGSGRLDIDLGGVLSVTEGEIFDSFNLFATDSFDIGDATFEIPSEEPTTGGFEAAVLSETATAPIDLGGPAPTQPAPSGQSGNTELAAPQAFKLTGSRASAAWAVGLVGLGAALAMAGTDYRRLRMRRRSVTPIT